MLYILPPPTAKPPSVWDLIINFHRKGCQDEAPASSKKSLKFNCRETKKSQRTWCKSSPSEPLHVSRTSGDLKSDQFHFLGWMEKSSSPSRFPTPKTRFFERLVAGNETLFSLSAPRPVDVHFTHGEKRFSAARLINSFSRRR